MVVARLVEVHILSCAHTLVTTRTLQGVSPNSNRAPHKDATPEKKMWRWQNTPDIARRFWWVKPHAIRLYHPPPLEEAGVISVDLNRGEHPSFGVLLQPVNVGRRDAVRVFPQTDPTLQLHLHHTYSTYKSMLGYFVQSNKTFVKLIICIVCLKNVNVTYRAVTWR